MENSKCLWFFVGTWDSLKVGKARRGLAKKRLSGLEWSFNGGIYNWCEEQVWKPENRFAVTIAFTNLKQVMNLNDESFHSLTYEDDC